MVRPCTPWIGLVLVAHLVPLTSVRGDKPLVVRSAAFDLEFAVNPAALPLQSVRLWYTLDAGTTWHETKGDKGSQSPIPFRAPREGLYGFFLVAANATGPSSFPPVPGSAPHQTVLVDFTPPVVQLHSVRQTTVLGRRVARIRWTAVDAHFGARPIEIASRRLPDGAWVPVVPEPLANTGYFEWRMSDALTGAVGVRVTVVDRVGHRTTSDQQVIEVVQPSMPSAGTSTFSAATRTNAVRDDSWTALPGSVRATQRAQQLFAEAIAHRERGEDREGISRLREAVKLNPQWAEPFAEMGDMLYRVGDLDRALGAYQLASRRQPMMRAALRGAAMVHRQRDNHLEAADLLRTILRHNPNDAEVWMNLGDVAIYQGDEVFARECYLRATQIDPGATQVIADARKRLSLMAEVSRSYRPTGP